jgi:excisionase family DNA binding protein
MSSLTLETVRAVKSEYIMANIPFKERISATIAEACEASGLGRTKIYELISEKKIETRKIGSRTLVLVPSLLRAIDPSSQPDQPKAA